MFLLLAGSLFWRRGATYELNYDEFIPLDAEALAEAGIKAAYEGLRPKLTQYVSAPAEVREIIDNDNASYSVACNGQEYFIYGGDNQEESWGRATVALFDIVNRQLAGTNVRLFALHDGNDLGGLFLTMEQVEASRKSLKKSYWPYLPVLQAPWYGRYH